MSDTNPLIPREELPAACRAEGCHVDMLGHAGVRGTDGGCDPDCVGEHVAHMVHVWPHGRTNVLPLTYAMFDDSNYEIWGTRVRSWLEALHGEVSEE